MNKDITILDDELVLKVTSIVEPSLFQSETWLFLEDQVPLAGFLLIDGHISLEKQKKINVLGPGSLIGIRELMSNQPAGHAARIHPNTKVCLLDKTTVQEILDSKPKTPEISNFFSNLIAN